MSVRLLVVVAAALLLFVLLHASITVPALSLFGLVAWAVFSSALAIVFYRRTRRSTARKGS